MSARAIPALEQQRPLPANFTLRTFGRIAFLIAAYVVFFWVTPAPFIVLPILIGIAAALLTDSDSEAGITGLLVGLVGPLSAFFLITPKRFEDYLMTAPTWANRDVLGSFYQRLGAFVFGTPDYQIGAGAAVAAVLFSVLTMAGLAYGLGRLARVRSADRMAVAVAFFICLGLVILISALSISTHFSNFDRIVVEDKVGYDGYQYARIYNLMRSGTPYYQAMFKVKGADSLLTVGKPLREVMKSGGANYRAPYIYYFWKYLAPSPHAIGYLALPLALLVFIILVYSGYRQAPFLGLVIGLAITPYLIVLSSGENVLFPTYWATLLLLAGLGFVLLEKPYIAGPVMLAAVAVREIAVILVGALFLAALFRREWRWLAVFGLVIGGGAIAFWAHNQAAVAVVGGSPFNQSEFRLTLVGYQDLLASSAYMMFPYGMFQFWPVVLAVTGLAGAFFAPHKLLGWGLAIYMVGFAVVSVFFYDSSYWGQLYMAPALLSTAFLINKALRPAEIAS